jgi:hypothetical protein
MKKLILLVLGLFLTSCANRVGFEVREPVTPEPILSCSVEEVAGGALITCPDGSDVFIADGSDGEDGEDGVDGTDGLDGLFVGYVDPCGSETAHDELLYLDRAGNVHAWFKGVGHVILNEGTLYQVTDGTGCKFKVQGGSIIDNL